MNINPFQDFTAINHHVVDEMANDLFSTSAFWILNKKLVRAVGPNAALYLVHLVDWHKHLKNMGKLIGTNDWFYSTYETTQEHTGINTHTQRLSIKVLVDLGVLQTEQKGCPSKQWLKLNINASIMQTIYNDGATVKAKVCENERLERALKAKECEIATLGMRNRTQSNNIDKEEHIQSQRLNPLSDLSGTDVVSPVKTSINRPVRPKPPEVDPDLPYKSIAVSLRKVMTTHYPNNKVTDKQVEGWLKPIKSMFTTTFGGTPEQVLEWLDIYCMSFDRKDKHHCVIMSGESLKDKIIKLENFVTNIQGGYTQSNKRPAGQNFEPADKSEWKNPNKITINTGA